MSSGLYSVFSLSLHRLWVRLVRDFQECDRLKIVWLAVERDFYGQR